MRVPSCPASIIVLCLLYFVSLCLLSLSWAEDVSPSSSASLLTSDNFTAIGEEKTKSDESVNGNSDLRLSEVVQSSFEEAPAVNGKPFANSEFAFADAAFQNSGVSNEITDTGQGVAFSLADAATAELRQRADIPSAITSHNETPNLHLNNSASEQPFKPTNLVMPNDTVEPEAEVRSDRTDNTQQTENVDIGAPPLTELKENLTEKSEDIPSFSEWAQKQLEEAEKKKELVNSSSQTNNLNGKSNSHLKVRSKNYASPDCGAKIVAANPEAVSASAVLTSSRDEYKLNACTNRIWFIVELCEAIQAKKIDLANFELFSSSPKDFTVSVSDRFPSRDWSNVGQFTAKDERDVQSFDLHPHLFGKFIKLEMHSHHGSEHYCPISLFRVYGTSEFEVLEKEDQAHVNGVDDDDDEETLDSDNGQLPKNLFSSATDAVISIVKKAAEVLGNKANTSNQTGEYRNGMSTPTKLLNSCTTPSHLVVCDNCSDVLYVEVYELMSCKQNLLYHLVKLKMIKRMLYDTETCPTFGLDFKPKGLATQSYVYSSYTKTFFSQRYLAALCNTLAILENKVVLNISKHFPNVTEDAPKNIHMIETIEPHSIPSVVPTARVKTDEVRATEELTLEKIELAAAIPEVSNTSHIALIKPTKTLTPENDLNTHTSASNKDDVKTVQPDTLIVQNHNVTKETDDFELTTENLAELEVTTESAENLDLDLISELNNLASVNNPNVVATPNTIPQVKESVFLRLSNRIKALERNMSLSGQYLEELSRRYKRQVEEMQKLLDKTLNALNEESKKRDEHNRRLEQQLNELSTVVQTLVAEKNNWITTTYWLFLVLVATFGIFIFCRRPEHKFASDHGQNVKIQRRKSIDVVRHAAPVKKERRPSEIALKISGSYNDLMKDNIEMRKKIRDRKKRRKKFIVDRSNSIGILAEDNAESDTTQKTVSDVSLQFRPTVMSSQIWNRQISAPAKIYEWDTLLKKPIEDIPFVLEESENSPLESLPVSKPLEQEPPKINGNAKVPLTLKLKDVTSPAFMKTASDSRTKRKSSPNGTVQSNGNKNKHEVHKKSASMDETRQLGPLPTSDTGSLNISYDEVKPATTPKKKSGIKRILRKVF